MINLYNGDCLEIMDKLIEQGVKVDCIITDPPYGTTSCKWDSVIPFDKMWERLNKLIKDNGVICLFGSEPFASALRMSNIKHYKYDWIWYKKQGSDFFNAKRKPLNSYENIILFYKKRCLYNPQMKKADKKNQRNRIKNYKKECFKSIYGKQNFFIPDKNETLRYPLNILEFSSQGKELHKDKRLHPTQKPLALMEYLVKTYTNENDIVLDFTMGSGTTGVACKNLNRNFIGIELDKNYFNIARERIENHTRQLELK